jgi:hemolysin activation/secretion protein
VLLGHGEGFFVSSAAIFKRRPGPSRIWCCALGSASVIACLSFAAQALAQPTAATLPGAVQPGRNDRPGPAIPTQPDFDFSIEAPSRTPLGRAVDTVTFTLRDINITGAKTIPAAAFRPLYTKLIGQTVKLSQILDVADAIEKMYQDRGYILVRAYVPPQRVRDGVFTINVVEGKIAHVTVEGGTPATQPASVQRPAGRGSQRRAEAGGRYPRRL